MRSYGKVMKDFQGPDIDISEKKNANQIMQFSEKNNAILQYIISKKKE